jgi:guanylate kinase
MQDLNNQVCLSVSHTTRGPRPGEKEGVNYHYISKESFISMIQDEKFVEYNKYSDNYYGTSKEELLKWGKENKVSYLIIQICILEIDINGASNILKSGLDAHYIGVLPPNFDELRTRILSRNQEPDEIVNKRLDIARIEIDEITKSEFFDFKLVNEDLNITYEEFKKCIFTLYPHLKYFTAERV